MNIDKIKTQLESMVNVIQALVDETDKLTATEKLLTDKHEKLIKKSEEARQMEINAKKIQNATELKYQAIKEEGKLIEIVKIKLEESKVSLKERMLEVDKKTSDFSNLEDKKISLDIREKELIKKEKDIKDEMELIKKEKIIDRERKEILDIRENKLEAREMKVQKYSEI